MSYLSSSEAENLEQESQRLAALHSLDVLKSPLDRNTQALMRMTRSLTEAESVWLAFVGEREVWTKAGAGTEPSRLCNFDAWVCKLARDGRGTGPEKRQQAGLALTESGLGSGQRFYAAPIMLEGRHAVGCVCLVTKFKDEDDRMLRSVERAASLVADQLELRLRRSVSRRGGDTGSKKRGTKEDGQGDDGHGRDRDKWPQRRDLKAGLEMEEFVLHYQPEVDLETGRVVGLEALVRWQHPVRGLVPPMEFIPEAEQNGMILPLGDWGLRQACRQMQEWKRRGVAAQKLRVCVNLSARQFARRGLVDHVESLLLQHELPAPQLGLELTESSLSANTAATAEILTRLHRMGVSLHMDDFGTGYSSLSHLHRFPFDILKIDRSFVQRMKTGSQPLYIVHTILELARVMGMDVIAEGIETPEQLRLLREMGCRYGQGYLFSAPKPEAEVRSLLQTLNEGFVGI